MTDDLRHRLFRRTRYPSALSPGNKIKQMTARTGGATTDDTGQPVPTDRYIYNTGPTKSTIRQDASDVEYSRSMRQARKAGSSVGSWRDPSTGKVSFDPSASSHDLGLAKAAGMRHGQHAVYDSHKKKDVVMCGKNGYLCAMHGGPKPK